MMIPKAVEKVTLVINFTAWNIYGIKNCNTVKKALGWLKENHIDFKFHDFKKGRRFCGEIAGLEQ